MLNLANTKYIDDSFKENVRPKVTQKDLLKAMEKEPCLTEFGMHNQRDSKFQGDRERLKNDFKQFKLCCEWISYHEKRKTINLSIGSSYSLKHVVESWAGEYIPNGVFIAAVIHLGITYKKYWDSPNINIALSSKGIHDKRS